VNKPYITLIDIISMKLKAIAAIVRYLEVTPVVKNRNGNEENTSHTNGNR
jgi:hypothetical protein